ncbi:MAG: proteasome subunit alpha, partial [Nitrospira sp.]|nr:proteasome subunit alpha [Nitrospira sp.]
YAKKGIAKGRSIIAMEYNHGVLLVADNPSTLNKISEVYDTIAFAGAGRYSEFENLRKAGIRHADLKGYLYSREDVTAKSLANAYSQSLGTSFSQDIKPLEVEILVVGLGEQEHSNEIYRITFDGSIYDEKGYTVIGGKSEALMISLKERYKGTAGVKEMLKMSIETLEGVTNQPVTPNGLEAAVLDRTRQGRKFKRFTSEEIKELIK